MLTMLLVYPRQNVPYKLLINSYLCEVAFGTEEHSNVDNPTLWAGTSARNSIPVEHYLQSCRCHSDGVHCHAHSGWCQRWQVAPHICASGQEKLHWSWCNVLHQNGIWNCKPCSTTGMFRASSHHCSSDYTGCTASSLLCWIQGACFNMQSPEQFGTSIFEKLPSSL